MKTGNSQRTCTQPATDSAQSERLGRVEEQLLVLRMQHGDHEAFLGLLKLYDRRVLYYVRRLVGNLETALEVSQEVWLTVHQRIISLRSPEAFRVWLFRVAHHKAATAARREHRRTEVHEEMASEDCTGETGDEIARFDDAPLVHLALAGISTAHREVLTLRFLEDLQLNEIAEVVECSVATAKTRLHYAKKAFRKKFEEIQQQKGLS